ncbi:DUF6049 family protein [Nocardia sp. CDC186]|uniref:DUF6049 family protein n=1 Tax=Nocardia implantans TaxID=3108168 RepID=A0ABU6AMY7_9NOCA|nr:MULTISPECIES: DUF6049 family protein [unclassified Nocardia]MBF6192006.1 hypothetical protein [Nocardia beijingensis]MEA3530136.1 DUF6049 family protein [Nocardia sp. CDC192]MEB3508844.1 DUF6049 family protein [Nocardia sp. CDC186]
MTRGLFRIFVAVLTILGPVTTLPLLDSAAAGAQPTGSGTSTNPKFLKLSLDSVTPTTVTAGSDPVLTVAGTVTNIGDRVVDDVSIRVQRAAAITTPVGLRATLRLDEVNYDVNGDFEDVAERLNPGQRKQFTLSIPLRSETGATSLRITEPGIYPLLLNVNGEPAYGTQARLDDARFLLPVLGVPPAPGDEAPVPAPTDAPVATTLLWPLADRPRQVGGHPGSVDGKVELTDDELAASLGKGGRLDQLLAALEGTLTTSGGRNAELASAVCLAVDPDLLLTVRAMTRGYRVLASPSDPDGATRAGAGAEQAQTWLDRLRALAGSMCTVALPFAQVDLTALAAVNDPALSARALNEPAEIIDSILSTRSVRGVSLPDSGSIDEGAGALLSSHGFGTAVLASTAAVPQGSVDWAQSSSESGRSTAGANEALSSADAAVPEVVRLPDITASQPAGPAPQVTGSPAPAASAPAPAADPALHAVTFDIWSATALAAVGSNPPTPPFTPSRVRYDVTNDSRAARLQDALGAISWSALHPEANRSRSLLLVPPQQWGANRDEATALLRQVDQMLRGNLATARPFHDLVALPPDPQPYQLDYLTQAAQDAVPDRFLPPVREQSRRITEMMRALVDVPEAEPTPHDFLTPLRDDLLRVLSLSDRRAGDAAPPDTFAQRRLDQNTRTMDKLYRSVTVLPPGGVYTLASEQSPLLLVARNDLPVAIRVKFRIEAPNETKITDPGEQQLPANGSRSFQIPTEVSDSRNLVIPISLTTPEGVALGNPTQVSVRSNAYGKALAIITGCAALLLLLLAGRRLWRRFRGQPDPADEGFDPSTRRRVNRYRRARMRVLRAQEQEQEQLQETR